MEYRWKSRIPYLKLLEYLILSLSKLIFKQYKYSVSHSLVQYHQPQSCGRLLTWQLTRWWWSSLRMNSEPQEVIVEKAGCSRECCITGFKKLTASVARKGAKEIITWLRGLSKTADSGSAIQALLKQRHRKRHTWAKDEERNLLSGPKFSFKTKQMLHFVWKSQS